MANYTPTPNVSNSFEELNGYIDAELIRLAELLTLNDVERVGFQRHRVEPPRPREGQLAYAPGAPAWAPTGAPGLFLFEGGAWRKVTVS